VADVIEGDLSALPILGSAIVSLIAAFIINWQGMWKWAAWTAFLAVVLTAVLLVLQARDGFRSLAMLLFPGLLLISAMLLDRVFYIATAGSVLITVAALGVAEIHGLTRAIPGVRSATNYESVVYVDLILLIFAAIGGRFVRDAESNVSDLRTLISRLSATNLELTESARALRESEAALRVSERQLKNAERIAHMGHWQWELQSNRVSGSDEMYRIFGKPLDYVPSYGGFMDDLMPPYRERMQELIEDSLATKVGHSIEYQVRGADGDLRTISCIWEVLVDDGGTPLRIFGTCQDITESRRAQEESFSRQKLETVGTLATGIAHDFNNLLGGVLGQAELALNELAAGSAPEKELKAIREVAVRGSEIVRELMIYAGKDSEVREPVDLRQIVKEMLELLKISVSKHASLETDFSEDLPAVWANAAQIRQVVMNVVANASEAIGERDGVVRVTTRSVKVDLDSSAAISDHLADGDYLQLEVSDTGCGMSEQTRARAFDPFFTTKSAGHGLGLAVVSAIVRGLGGAIRVTSEPGKGTTFQILLPRAKAGSGGSSGAMPSSDLAAGPQHAAVLVVEDEDILREAVVKMLRKKGFEVFEAANGTSAIDLLRAKIGNIDLILLDMTIPGASSREVVAEAAKLHPSTRVVLTSAYSQDMITRMMDAPQIASFIRKPFRIGDLVQTLQSALLDD
jgi:PAS domain S-box-containing protein